MFVAMNRFKVEDRNAFHSALYLKVRSFCGRFVINRFEENITA